ncbi:MAG: 4Fe-4S binding protein, partial [Bacillota bacterium]|nr:4Fe-4S binding protein [Bacillota bacterium]
GSCPIGSLQAVLSSRQFSVSFYVLGFLMAVGALWGRFVCGWLCPFGLVQDLIYKIPFPKKVKKIPADRYLKGFKYVMLAVFVILLPLFAVDITGMGDPWFCKYVCPSGTLMAGLPLLAANVALRSAAGWLFAWKSVILAAILFLSLLICRPFCRYLCPLGALYGFMNKASFYRLVLEEDLCIHCGKCEEACDLGIPVLTNQNSMECIRCGDCKNACPTGALHSTLDRLSAHKTGTGIPGRPSSSK